MASLKLDTVIDGRCNGQLEWNQFLKQANSFHDAQTVTL